MLEIIEVDATNDEFRYMEKLLVNSFPSCEYRDINQYKAILEANQYVKCNLIFKKKTPIGLINFWEFNAFIFIEHFAIDPLFRNLGYGKRVLGLLKEKSDKPLVLEVEQPTSELTKRRIQFYQRTGFEIYSKTYHQPPYREGEKEIAMFLMGTEDLFNNKDSYKIKETLYAEVYSYEMR